jgi:hypothetical protein
VTITIADTNTNPQLLTPGQTLNAFKNVTVKDSGGLATTETVAITLSQNSAAGSDYYYSGPSATDLGTITDPNGGGHYDAATHTFTETGLVGGDPTFATTLLSRLVYTPPALANGQGLAEAASIVVSNGIFAATDPTPDFIGEVTPNVITGTVANAPIAGGDKIPPFARVSITAPSFYYDYSAPQGYIYYSYNPKDTATITVTDGGNATDADGLLTGPGLSKSGVGTYSLGPDFEYNIASELQHLSFQTVAVPAGQTRNPAFKLTVTDTTSGLTTQDTVTSLLVMRPTAGPPNIAGTSANQSVISGNVISPFSGVTISDANASPIDSVTITLKDVNGTTTDANGTLVPAAGLTETAAGSGVYNLAASDPATLTNELDHLVFVPSPIPGGQTSVTTNFALSATNTGINLASNDTKTSVVETGATQPAPLTAGFDVVNETTGKVYQSVGEPYTGPVAGISNDIILITSDNINVTALSGNVFIKSGSGDDGLNVAAANGNNILDGSTGSNFLTGGTGNDTFYVDARQLTANVWSSVVNFHAGDSATVWGVTAADFNLTWLPNEGATGFTGLTGVFVAAGNAPEAAITLAGYTEADLTNGRLTVTFGKTDDLPGLPGSNYLTIAGH